MSNDSVKEVYNNKNTKQKNYEDLDFTDDFIFCKVLTHNPEVCEELLELILGRNVCLARTEKQVPIEVTTDGHGVRFDVYSEDDEGNRYDIEMQVVKKPEIAKRSRYYQSMIDLDMLDRGISYSELNDGYVIFICTFDPFGEGLPKYSYENICLEMPEKRLDDGSHKVFLNTKAIIGEKAVELKTLFKYINNREVGDDFTRRLDNLVAKARRNKEWRLEYMTLHERDMENKEIGKAEGRQQLIKQLVSGEVTLDELKDEIEDDSLIISVRQASNEGRVK